jgi:hypothetical protein
MCEITDDDDACTDELDNHQRVPHWEVRCEPTESPQEHSPDEANGRYQHKVRERPGQHEGHPEHDECHKDDRNHVFHATLSIKPLPCETTIFVSEVSNISFRSSG